MAVTTPLTILVTEGLDHLTNRWRQAQRETEQYLLRARLHNMSPESFGFPLCIWVC